MSNQIKFNIGNQQVIIQNAQNIKDVVQQLKDELKLDDIIGFSTIENYQVADFILQKDNYDASILFGHTLNVKPLFGQYLDDRINIRHFEIIEMIGQGGFSYVYLARLKTTGKLMALKVIDKQNIIKNALNNQIMNERDILTNIKHPYIVKLHYAFQTKNYLIFASEFCPGGDLFNRMQSNKRISQNNARIYFIQICLALFYLHDLSYVYRDLKPENILIDIDGNFKITDFTVSKQINQFSLQFSFCGSRQYMSPEMLKKEGHSFQADYYALGNLLYEMIFKQCPFFSQSNEQIQHDILYKEVEFKSNISNDLKSIILQLLEKNPEKRLGSKNGIQDILNHPWCKKIDIKYVKSTQKLFQPLLFDKYFDTFNEKIQKDLIKSKTYNFQS